MRSTYLITHLAAVVSLLCACSPSGAPTTSTGENSSVGGNGNASGGASTGKDYSTTGGSSSLAAGGTTSTVVSTSKSTPGGGSSNQAGGSGPGAGGSGTAWTTGGSTAVTKATGGGTSVSKATGGATSVSKATGGSTSVAKATGGSTSRTNTGGTGNSTGGVRNGTGGSSAAQATGGVSSNATGGTNGTAGSGCLPSSYPLPSTTEGYSELPDGRCGTNIESVSFPAEVGFDKAASLAAFKTTLYPLLSTNCSGCHNTANTTAHGAQAPIHGDKDPGLAHEYALARANLRNPEMSRYVTRMTIDRHNCFGSSCKDAGAQMLTAIKAWAAAIPNALPAVPWGVAQGTQLAEADIIAAIKADKASLSSADAPYIKYVSFHEVHNSGASAEELNLARVGLSKTLNSLARWAPAIMNPTDVDGRGIIYRFDSRWYWGYNKGVTKLLWGGSDDDLVFGTTKDVNGNAVSQSFFSTKVNFAASVTQDPNFANLVWTRVLKGNVEGARQPAANITGFKTDYVEAGQLAYTLSRPDVYNAVMVLPPSSTELEAELGVDRTNGMQSYQWVGIEQAITKDSRLLFRAKTSSGGMYYKTFDIFSGQEDAQKQVVNGHVSRWPFWANPVPKPIAPPGYLGGNKDYSFFATLEQAYIGNGGTEPAGCEGQTDYGSADYVNCRYYTGTDGLQESAEEVIWNLPNGLQGYELLGAFNQRRVDAFNLIVTDYNLHTTATDKQITTWTETGASVGDAVRLNTGSSCFGCHVDGMNRFNNDLRDYMEAGTLPTGAPMGSEKWVNDQSIISQVQALYPQTADMRPVVEADRKRFVTAMAKIRGEMMLGPDKNLYGLEPTYWLNSWTKKHYSYATNTQSNN